MEVNGFGQNTKRTRLLKEKALKPTSLAIILLGLLGAVIGLIEGVVIGSFLGSGAWVIFWAILMGIFNVIVLGRIGFLLGRTLSRRTSSIK